MADKLGYKRLLKGFNTLRAGVAAVAAVAKAPMQALAMLERAQAKPRLMTAPLEGPLGWNGPHYLPRDGRVWVCTSSAAS